MPSTVCSVYLSGMSRTLYRDKYYVGRYIRVTYRSNSVSAKPIGVSGFAKSRRIDSFESLAP